MSLFWFLHRVGVVLFWGFWIAVAIVLYQHREALMPLRDLGELAWHRKPAPADGHPRMEGRGVRAYSGNGFEFRGTNGVAFNWGLAGVTLPRATTNTPEEARTFVEAARSNLHQFIAGQSLAIEVLVSNPEARMGLGVAFAGSTNLNLLVLSQGFGLVQRGQIRSLPLRQQWDFLEAERAARQRSSGIWQTHLAELRTTLTAQ